MAADVRRRARRVFSLHGFHLGMAGKKGAALRESHGMGMHLGDGVPAVLGQAADGMLYVQFVLPYHGGAALAQQLVVVEQRARDGVLYGQHAHHGGVSAYVLEHLLESGAANQLYLFLPEILMGGYVVERALLSLYRYSFHLVLLSSKKRPCSPWGAGPFRYFLYLQ